MTASVGQLWVYLQTTPLLWLTVTLIAYQIGNGLFRLSNNNPLCNPVLIAVAGLVVLLRISGTDYKTYFSGAQFVHFLLGPATVALAVPLYAQIRVVRRSLFLLAVSLVSGSALAAASGAGLAALFGGTTPLILSLAPKSVTSPIAMGIADQIGGLPSLTAVLVIVTGITGATFGPWILDRLKVSDPAARGVAMGVASHGIGTARAMQMSPVSGAFAGLAMGLNGVLTAILLPFVVSLFR